LNTVVIGAGPIGIETAVELRRRGIDAHIFDAGPIGHTISWWAPGTRWFSSNDRIAIAGVPLHTVDQAKASREEYLNYLRTVVDQYQIPVHTFHRLVRLEPIGEQANANRWRLGFVRTQDAVKPVAITDADLSLNVHSVVLAIGGTDFPNRLNVPGDDLPHVDGYLREVHRYFGRRVLIVGGRNSAVEAAIRLHRGGARVSLCYHGEQLPVDGIKYWLRPEIEGLIRSGSISAYFGARVAEITRDHVRLHSSDQADSSSTFVEVDDVLALIGYRQDTTMWQQLGIVSNAESAAPVYDPDTMQTPREGVYVAGTAIGGTQSSRYQIFLENCHDHARKIADHLCGESVNTLLEDAVQQRVECLTGLQQRIALQPES
jgi:thioredoxin reductase (NADPH)